MKSLKDNPLFLLLATGGLLGLYFPLGRLAHDAGLNPLLWALIISLGPGVILVLASLRDREGWGRGWGFALAAAVLAYVIPNGITFAAISHIGSGFMALMYACSPIVTAVLSMAFGVRPPSGRLLAGVALGFGGAVLIAWSRSSAGWNSETMWALLAFLVPLSLGLGNVFRTAYWPEGVSPLRLAAQTNVAAVLPLGALLIGSAGLAPFGQLANAPALVLLQVIVSTAMFVAFFRLQWVGGPTYLSQIGYVGAAVGLAAGVFFLRESYPVLVWAGAGLIATGVVVSNLPQRQAKPSQGN
ncbi:MAG: DMT family transporter [Proteobacteria bacterium]|nr:DMT family transporter [Pseudomonadota bacterium]